MNPWQFAAVLLSISLSAGASVQSNSPAPAKSLSLSDLSWLSGCWKADPKESRINNIEIWSKPHGNIMIGAGAEVKGGKATSWEHMRIEARDDGKIVYTTRTHNQKEVSFNLVSTSAGILTFENPGTDFPKKVTYRKEENGNLEIRVDGEVAGKRRAALYAMQRNTCN